MGIKPKPMVVILDPLFEIMSTYANKNTMSIEQRQELLQIISDMKSCLPTKIRKYQGLAQSFEYKLFAYGGDIEGFSKALNDIDPFKKLKMKF